MPFPADDRLGGGRACRQPRLPPRRFAVLSVASDASLAALSDELSDASSPVASLDFLVDFLTVFFVAFLVDFALDTAARWEETLLAIRVYLLVAALIAVAFLLGRWTAPARPRRPHGRRWPDARAG